MDTQRIVQTFHRDGVAIVPNVFTREEIADIDQHLVADIKKSAPTLGPGDVYYEDSPQRPIKSLFRLHERSDFFRRLMADRRLIDLLQAVWVTGEVIQDGFMFFGKPARDGSVTPPHQDNAFQNWDPPMAITVTLAIDESTPENGALTCQAGTHKLGLQPHRQSGVMGFSKCLVDPLDPDTYPDVQLCMQPGDVALHHINTVHRSDANQTDRPRRQLGISYHCSLAKRDKEAWDRYHQQLAKLHQDTPSQ